MNIFPTSEFEEDVIGVLEWSLEKFGYSARDRYSHLIKVALDSIADDPFLKSSQEFGTLRLYHLRHSKKHAHVDGIIVKDPKHLIAYRVDENTVEALRLLHQRMELADHLEHD